ncbi:MAG: hypothetical protein ACTS4Y_00940 [Candidatus Hodgkinia cicadicola]
MVFSFWKVVYPRTKVGELYDYNLNCYNENFNNEMKCHRNEMMIWVTLNRVTKRTVATYLRSPFG